MKVAIVPTPKVISVDALDREGLPRLCRVWNGVTEKGAKCTVFVLAFAVEKTEDQKEFETDLREFIPKDKTVFSLRDIL